MANQTKSASSFFVPALKGGAMAAGINLALYFATSAAGVEFIGQFDPSAAAQPLPVPMVAVSSIVPAIFAATFALVLSKFATKAGAIFLFTSIGFLLLSFMGPLGIGGASLGTKVVLNAMHVVAGLAIAIPLLRGPLRVD